MLYPVTRAGQLIASAFSPASVIVNQGPGTLYLYRNSAVSTAAYDTIVGPSGSFQWPGGELWAASDATTIVNVLAGLSGFDSGTTNVAGTVNVAGGGSVASPAIRATVLGQTNQTGQASLVVPSNVIADDYLLLFAAQNNQSQTMSIQNADAADWQYYQPSSNLYDAVFWRKTKVGDAGSTLLVGPFASTNTATLILFVIKGASNLRFGRELYVGSGFTSGTIDSTTVSRTDLIVGSHTSGTLGTWAWGSQAQGGPPTAPPLSSVETTGGGRQRAFVSTPNWDAAAYALSLTTASAVSMSALTMIASK